MSKPMQTLEDAITLRTAGKHKQAIDLLEQLAQQEPSNPDIDYQIAWTLDSLGKEPEAVTYYENALSKNLVTDRCGALLGLGSTYRCLGKYESALKTFDQAVQEFPQNRALKVFRAITLFNLNDCQTAVEQLLVQLLDTTQDAEIKLYDEALRFYSDKLKTVWP